MIYTLFNRFKGNNKLPKASEVLNCYLKQENYPYWTSYFVKAKDVLNDQYNMSYFIHKIDNRNRYLVLRTGCFPFIKYHCTKLKQNELVTEYDQKQIKFQNSFCNLIKIINFGKLTIFFSVNLTMFS